MILFLDISSTCTGYTIAEKSGGEIVLKKVGALWFDGKADIAEKCRQLYRFVINTDEEYKFEKIVFEKYSFNMSMRQGALVCPQLQGAVLTAVAGLGLPFEEITPQTWRKQCGLKKKHNDWKITVTEHFEKIYAIPEKMESNITGNLRKTPSDVFDSIGICEGFYRLQGFRKFRMEK